MKTHTEFRGAAIKEIRDNMGMSLVEFIHKSGCRVSRQAVSRWELGIDIPATRLIVRMANSFQLPISYFFCTKIISDDNKAA